VTGLALQPTQGYKQSRSKGLATGVGKGLIGAFFKPIAGKMVVAALEAHTELSIGFRCMGIGRISPRWTA
jgi:hypothetical protein